MQGPRSSSRGLRGSSVILVADPVELQNDQRTQMVSQGASGSLIWGVYTNAAVSYVLGGTSVLQTVTVWTVDCAGCGMCTFLIQTRSGLAPPMRARARRSELLVTLRKSSYLGLALRESWGS